MTQPGHSTNIYTATTDGSPYRYSGDYKTANTEFVPADSKGHDFAYEYETVTFADATADFYVIAPCDGALAGIVLTSDTTTSGTNKVTVEVTNASDSDANLTPAQTWDDDPVATALTPIDGTVTVGNTVSRGDKILVDYDETGTIAGGSFKLIFENF